MSLSERITTIRVPQSDYGLFQRLMAETGVQLEKPIFQVVNVPPGLDYKWHNSDVKDSVMAVRGVVRDATLEQLGANKGNWHWVLPPGSTKSSFQEVGGIIGNPDFMHYQWQDISDSNLGDFRKLKEQAGQGPYVNIKKSVLLFSDEVEKLAKGETVVADHRSGFGSGYVMERMEAFTVLEGRLHRVRAYLSD